MKRITRYLGRILVSGADFTWGILHRDVDINDTIAIFGAPRSGTTWIMEILYYALNDRWLVFEPLYNESSYFKILREKVFKDYFFPPWRPYIPVDKEDSILYSFFVKVFKGRILQGSLPTHRKYHSDISRWFKSDKVLVKFIRANRLLPWILKRFTLRGTILIIRHPCATITSQINRGWYPKNEDEFLIQKKNIIMQINTIDELVDHERLIKIVSEVKRLEELLAVTWSLDYYIPLKYHGLPWFKPYILFYESLVLNGEDELRKIFKYIRYSFKDDYLSLLHKPSITVFNSKVYRDPYEQLGKWRKQLDKDVINRILKIVNEFNVGIYTEDLEPDYNYLRKV